MRRLLDLSRERWGPDHPESIAHANNLGLLLIGEGRLVFAPIEDLMFGFALVLLSLSLWVFWGRRGVQRTPMSGPPIWRR